MAAALRSASVSTGGIGAAKLQAPSAATAIQPDTSGPAAVTSGAKVEKVYLSPKSVDFRKSIDDLAALMELDIKVAVFDPVLFVFLNKPRSRVKILYWERNGFAFGSNALNPNASKHPPLKPTKHQTPP